MPGKKSKEEVKSQLTVMVDVQVLKKVQAKNNLYQEKILKNTKNGINLNYQQEEVGNGNTNSQSNRRNNPKQ